MGNVSVTTLVSVCSCMDTKRDFKMGHICYKKGSYYGLSYLRVGLYYTTSNTNFGERERERATTKLESKAAKLRQSYGGNNTKTYMMKELTTQHRHKFN